MTAKLAVLCVTFLVYSTGHELFVDGRVRMELETRLRIELMRCMHGQPRVEIPTMRRDPRMSL